MRIRDDAANALQFRLPRWIEDRHDPCYRASCTRAAAVANKVCRLVSYEGQGRLRLVYFFSPGPQLVRHDRSNFEQETGLVHFSWSSTQSTHGQLTRTWGA